jgi:hypothetical protein
MLSPMSRLRFAAVVLLGAGALTTPGSALAAAKPHRSQVANSSRATEKEAEEARADSAPEPLCTRRINEPGHGREAKVTEPIELEVRTTDPVLNFGDGRGTLYDYVVLKASKAIPPDVPSANFEIDSLEPMRRIGGEGLESARLRVPTYSRPHFFNHRTELGFSLCVTAASGKPGTYTGQFLFVGPGAIASVPITQTAQLKIEEWKFLIALVIVLLVTLAFLGVRALAEFDGEAEPREVIVKMSLLLISVAAAGLAMYLVYDKTPTWGDDLVVNGAALIATAFTAAGLGNTLAAGTGKISDSLGRAKKSRQSLKKSSRQSDAAGSSEAK